MSACFALNLLPGRATVMSPPYGPYASSPARPVRRSGRTANRRPASAYRREQPSIKNRLDQRTVVRRMGYGCLVVSAYCHLVPDMPDKIKRYVYTFLAELLAVILSYLLA